jgi:hypothetical protein
MSRDRKGKGKAVYNAMEININQPGYLENRVSDLSIDLVNFTMLPRYKEPPTAQPLQAQPGRSPILPPKIGCKVPRSSAQPSGTFLYQAPRMFSAKKSLREQPRRPPIQPPPPPFLPPAASSEKERLGQGQFSQSRQNPGSKGSEETGTFSESKTAYPAEDLSYNSDIGEER